MRESGQVTKDARQPRSFIARRITKAYIDMLDVDPVFTRFRNTNPYHEFFLSARVPIRGVGR